jgi:hypothetical protein
MRNPVRPPLKLAAAAFALALLPAFAQNAPAPLKGKVKEGLYEMKTDHDLTGVPGVPKEAAKGSETRQVCMTKQDTDKGIQAGKDCAIKSAKEGGGGAQVRMECKDGSVTDMNIAVTGSGYTTEMKTTGKQDGKAFSSHFKSTARYLGPCPK